MPSNKDRLYVVLYARSGAPRMPGKEDTYHWALLVGPKAEVEGGQGMRYHVKERPKQSGGSEWFFEERKTPLAPSNMLLIRVMIGKVENHERLVRVLRKTPLRHGQPGWNCVGWVKETLEELSADGKALGTSVVGWDRVRDGAMGYCQRKKDQHRFDGKGNFDMRKAATYDLVEEKETIP
ncbi:hypothetical protein MMC11_008936 [Xylographa trunciseda]|nr:hypothetical protein [Xylographa trunciseda]